MIAFTCPHCGGGVRYDLSSGAVKCEYCDGLITQDDYEGYLEKKGLYQTTELCCPQCGSIVLSYDNTLATFCSYCGSSVLFDRRVREEQKPDGMIPFSFKQKAAMNRYRERTQGLLLTPDWVREEGRKDLTGIYMPFYLYKASYEEPVSLRGNQSRSRGSTTEVSVYRVDGTLHGVYQGNRFDAAVAFPDAMSESIDTYQWQKAEPFRPGYVAGFYADGSDVDPREYDPVVRELISNDINENAAALKYDGMRLYGQPAAARPEKILLGRKKILLPVWLLTHRVGERICYAAINGQTGDVAADLPLDQGRYLKVSLIAASVLALVLDLFFTVKPAPFLIVSMILTALFGVVLSRLTQQVYVRENHLDDIGRIGYTAFAEAVKSGGGVKERQPAGCSRFVVYGAILFIAFPLLYGLLSELFPELWLLDLSVAIWPVAILLVLIRFLSGLVRSAANAMGAGTNVKKGGTKWQYSRPLAASFSVLWKIWLALAVGAVVLMSGTVEDWWYYGTGLANIAVSVWASFDVIRKQNLLASRDIPLFSMKRGGAE